MILVDVQSLKPGRILASDVKNSHGQLLIKKGAEVTERHVRVLKSWGVVDVQVEGECDEESEENAPAEHFDPALMERARVEVMDRLRHNSIEHPAIDELVRLCVRRRVRELSGQITS